MLPSLTTWKGPFRIAGRAKVQREFGGVPYRGSTVNRGEETCLGILKLARQRIGKQPGDVVPVGLWREAEGYSQ